MSSTAGTAEAGPSSGADESPAPAAGRARTGIAWQLPAPATLAGRLAGRRRHTALLVATDLALVAAALAVSELSASRASSTTGSTGWMALYAGLTLAILAARGGYRPGLRISLLDDAMLVVTSAALAATVVTTLWVLAGIDPQTAVHVVRWWGFTTVYVAAGRAAVGLYRMNSDAAAVRTLIVGAGTVGHLVARRLLERPQAGLLPIGFLDKEPLAGEGTLEVLGASWDLEAVIERERVEHVVVTFSTAPNEVLLGLIRRCRELGVEVSLVPRLFEEVSTRVEIEHLGGMPLLRVAQADPRGWQFDVKYALDRAAGVVLVVLLAPLLGTIALLVRLTSPGPVLFRQQRMGLDGRPFAILKFRTMREAPPGEEADAAWAASMIGDEAPAPAAQGADRRTPIGAFLRRWSLDELPQILNVARGEMSLIGPRPERMGYAEAFTEHVYRYGDRHRVKSGLTGWAQVNGLRGETELGDRVEWDNFYIENWTPWLDLKILLMTPVAVLRGAR